MIYYGPQLDIGVKTFANQNLLKSSLLNFECLDRLPNLFGDSSEKLWSFELMMGFIFQQRASQYIININRTPVSKVMVIWICVGIPYQLSSAMIYYGAQLDIWVKTFARQNLPESSLLNFECLNKFPALCGDPEESLLPFVLAMGFIFQQRPSQYIININHTPVSKVMVVWILRGHSIWTFECHDILWASIGNLSQNFCPSIFVWVFLVKFWVPR